MRVPEITYGFASPTDTAGVTFEILSRQFSTSGAANPVLFLLSSFPKDRILVITNIAFAAHPGATQNVEELKIQGVTQAGLIFDIATDVLIHAADEEVSLNWDGEVYIQGGGDGRDSLRVSALFNSGAVANTATIGWQGIIIPHGNAGAF